MEFLGLCLNMSNEFVLRKPAMCSSKTCPPTTPPPSPQKPKSHPKIKYKKGSALVLSILY